MNIDKYITLVTFIPWLLIIMVSMIFNLNKEDYQKFSIKYLSQNIFKIFRLDTLLLIVCFWYFSSFGREFVNKYLFAIMCLYLFVNFFYEKRALLKKGFFKENIINILLLIIIVSSPFIYYAQTNNLDFTYKLMLIYLFLSYFIVLLINTIARLLKKLLPKNDSH